MHGKAERSARRTTVYLLPGLTGPQRGAALRRLRQEASRGCGPALPAPQLMVALGMDRARGAVRGTTAVIRLHPVATLVPATATVALMTLFVLGSVRIVHLPGSAAQPAEVGAGPVVWPPTASAPASRLRVGGAGGGSAGKAVARGQRESAARPASSAPTGDAGLGSGAPARTASPAAAASESGTAQPSVSASASSSAGTASTAASAAAAAASSAAAGVMNGVTPLLGGADPAPSPSPGSSAPADPSGQTQVCLGLGPLGAYPGL